MSPAEVRAYVDALKSAGLMSCHLRIPIPHKCEMGSGPADVLELALQFAPPELPMVPGAEITPGGWKGPSRLDADFELDPPGSERTVTKD